MSKFLRVKSISLGFMIIKRKFKSGHLAYKNKGNAVYNIIHANSLPLHTHFTPGMGSKGQSIFVKMAILHAKLRRI